MTRDCERHNSLAGPTCRERDMGSSDRLIPFRFFRSVETDWTESITGTRGTGSDFQNPSGFSETSSSSYTTGKRGVLARKTFI